VRILVTKEITKEAAIIFNVKIDQSRKAVRVNAITVRLVVLSVARVVYHESIQSGGTANHNTIHGVGLVLGALLVAVLFPVNRGKIKESMCVHCGQCRRQGEKVKQGDRNKYRGFHSSSEPNGRLRRTKKFVAFAFW
jgi:hypothetical protein